MNSTNIIKQVSTKREGATKKRRIFPLLIGLTLVTLIAFSVYWSISSVRPAADHEVAANLLAVNPELKFVRRYEASVANKVEASFEAANPEVMLFRRYAASTSNPSESDYLAANPELKVAYLLPAVDREQAVTDLATNPELKAAYRLPAKATQVSETDFLSSNPEINRFRNNVANRQGE